MRKSRLPWLKQTKIIGFFAAGSTARAAAALVAVNKTSAVYYFHRLRVLIYEQMKEKTLLHGEVEIDESDFDGTRKGRHGRGAQGKKC